MRGLFVAATLVGGLSVAAAEPAKPAPAKAAPAKAKAVPAKAPAKPTAAKPAVHHPRETLAAHSAWAAQPAGSMITLASLSTQPDPRMVRVLHTQGLAAYQAGKYDLSAKKFTAALEVNETPELVYHAAQAFRMKGDRAQALAHYERYLELAPDGAAAPVCRAHIERLAGSLP